MTIMIPRINLNGTDGNVLLQENMDALAAVSNAIVYLGNVTVHGRDFQTVSDPKVALWEARKEHQLRLRKLQDVERELAEIATNLSEQIAERQRWRESRS